MKWKPSKKQKKSFVERMKDPEKQLEYTLRKEKNKEKRQSKSRFDYDSAGGFYVPTQAQYRKAFDMLCNNKLNVQQEFACREVIFGYTSNEKINHDSIHVVNDF